VASDDHAVRLCEIYTQSLFELAESAALVDTVEQELLQFKELCDNEPLFYTFLTSPYFTYQDKQAFVHRVLDPVHGPLTRGFLDTVLHHNRAFYLFQMIERFESLCDAYGSRCQVRVTVANDMTRVQEQAMYQSLTEAIGAQVKMTVEVDPSILGGTVIRYADKLVDNSIGGRLRDVTQHLIRQ